MYISHVTLNLSHKKKDMKKKIKITKLDLNDQRLNKQVVATNQLDKIKGGFIGIIDLVGG